ncbi:MAG: hypothetical protein AAGA60_14865 [Cyanobacteria bacterium P01_E01_bin.42]
MRTQLHQQLLNLDYGTRQPYGRIEILSDRSSKSQICFIATRPIPRSLSLFWQFLHCLESQLRGNLFDLAEEYYDLVLDAKLNGESVSLPNHLNSLPSELVHTLEIAAECQAKTPDPQIRDRLFQLIQKLESTTPLDADSFAETALPLVRDVILQARETGKSVAEVVESYQVKESDPLRCNILNCLFEDAVANLPQGIRLARIIGNPDVSFLAQLESQPSLDSIKVSSLSLSEGTIVRVIKCLWEQQLDFDIDNCKELSLPQSAMCRTEAGQLCLVPREALQFLGDGQDGDR